MGEETLRGRCPLKPLPRGEAPLGTRLHAAHYAAKNLSAAQQRNAGVSKGNHFLWQESRGQRPLAGV